MSKDDFLLWTICPERSWIEYSCGLRREMAINIVMVHNAYRDLSFGYSFDNLRTFLIHMRARIAFQTFKKLFRSIVVKGCFDNGHSLEILAAGIGNGNLVSIVVWLSLTMT